MKNIVAVDAGKSYVKFYMGKEKLKFPNKIEETEDKITLSDSGIELMIDNKRYIVGDGVDTSLSYDSDKITERTKLLVLSAIASRVEELKPEKDENINISLAIGMPAGHFNQKNKQEMQSLLKGQFQIQYKNKFANLKINEVLVLPEGFVSNQWNAYNKVLLVDIGFRNANIIILNKGGIQSMQHSDLGSTILKDIVEHNIESTTRNVINLELDELEYCIQYQYKHFDKKAKELCIKKYMNLLFDDLKRKVDLYKFEKIIFRGGTTQLIKGFREYVPEEFKESTIIDGDEFKNVEAFYNAAKSFWKEE